jgi:hypothetical protein
MTNRIDDLEQRITKAERIADTPWRVPVEQPREFWTDALEELARVTLEKSGGNLTAAQAAAVALQTPQGKALYAAGVRAQPAPVEPRPAPSEPDPSSAEGQLVKIAQTIREGDPSLTRAESMAKAVTRNPHLYDQYNENQ